MQENMELNFTPELAALLSYIAEVATVIRLYSDYSGGDPHRFCQNGCTEENPGKELMWLADSLHNLNYLGNTILGGSPALICQACDAMLSAYRRYKTAPSAGSKETFDLWNHRFSLDTAIDIFEAIKQKAAAGVTTENGI